MAIQIKRQGNENAATCSDAPLIPKGLSYGELAVDSAGYIYTGNGTGNVVSLIRNSDKSKNSSQSDESLHSVDSDALSGKRIGTGVYNSSTEFIPYVQSDGGIDIGKYLDFHSSANSSIDFSLRLDSSNNQLSFKRIDNTYCPIYTGNIIIDIVNSTPTINNCGIDFQYNNSSLWKIGIESDILSFKNSQQTSSLLSLNSSSVKIDSGNSKEAVQINSSSSQGAQILFQRNKNSSIVIGEGVGTDTPNTFGIQDAVSKKTFFYTDTSGYCHSTRMYGAVYNDYAEFFPRGEETEPGDIIALDIESENEQYIKATSDSKKVVGVHSNEYAHLIGGEEPTNGMTSEEYNLKKYIPVGLVGRCRVKTIGKIQKGDDIVPSNIPGVGKAWNKAEDNLELLQKTIGFAVESSEDENIKLVRVKLRG